MRFSTAFPLATVLLTPLVVSAAPLKRGANANDVLVLRFAGVLEALETKFYQTVLDKFKADDFTNAGFASGTGAVQQFQLFESEESTHDTTLTALLQGIGASPIEGCQFDVSSLTTDVSTAVSSAREVEHTGVGAYLGAANLLTDPHLLTDAASILSIEARHSTVLNMFSRATTAPEAFDIPMSPSEVLAIVSPVISGCDVGINANQPLTITNTGTLTAGTVLTFKSPAFSSTQGLSCQILAGGASEATVLPADQCAVPANVNGQVLVFVTQSNSPLSGDVINREVQTVEAGPAIAFFDEQDDQTSDLIRKSS
jgi:hypothetical protein